MKHIYPLVLFIFLALITHAQDNNDEYKTILKGKSRGGYGAAEIGYAQIDNRNGLSLGARGGVLFGNNFALGVGGKAFLNSYEHVKAINKDASLIGGYGGLFTEIIVAPKWPVHLSFPVLFGLGGVSYSTLDKSNSDIIQKNDVENTATFFIAEPAVELNINLLKFMRIAFYGSYRFTTNLKWDKTTEEALKSYSTGIIFKFGKFQ